VFEWRADLTKLDEADIATLGIGRKFQKPTVFAEPHGARQPLWRWPACEAGTPAAGCAHRPRTTGWTDPLDHSHGPAAAHAGRPSQPRPEAVLEIGMLLAQDPKLLLVDEPSPA